MTAHAEERPSISKQKDIKQHHTLLASLSDALNDYEGFPEPHLNAYRLQILGELLYNLF